MSTAPDRQTELLNELEEVPLQTNGADGPATFDDSQIPDSAYEDEPRAQSRAKRESQADEVVKFVCRHCELSHDENRDVYAIDRQSREVRHIDRRAFKHWVLSAYYGVTGRAVRSQALSEALQTLAGIGRHQGFGPDEIGRAHV